MKRFLALAVPALLVGGCARGDLVKGPYAYSPPKVIKKDKPSLAVRAVVFPFRDETKNESKIEKRKISLNYLKKGHEKIPVLGGEKLAEYWAAFLRQSKTFSGVGLAFGDSPDRRGQVGLGGSVVQAQYLIEEPVCLLRIRVLFEARKSGEDSSFWKEDLFESGRCSVDAKDARKQRKAFDEMFHALFTKALKSLEAGLEFAPLEVEEGSSLSETGEEDEKKPAPKKAIGNDSVVDELYRRALDAQ
jgi:hypothetical protein